MLKLESASSEVGTRPLEDIFGNSVARVLDFLIINEPFEYSLEEISQFVRIPTDAVRRIIQVLVEKGIVQEISKKRGNREYKLDGRSDLALSLSQYVFTKINYDIEREKSSRTVKANVPTAAGGRQLNG
jgi:predicted transcriptional regulator